MSRKIELQPGDRVLISRTDRLGDLILALPFIETFKARYPECDVDVISSLYASPILENNSRIHKILRVQNDQLLTNKLYKKDLLQKIKKENYRAVIVLYPERQISRLFYQADIPFRFGTAGRFHSIFFNVRLLHSRKKNVKHEYKYNLDFMRYFRRGKTINRPQVFLRDKELNSAQRILSEAGVTSSRFVVLHPGSGGSAESWPMDKFVQLYGLVEKQNVEAIITGSEREGIQIREVAASSGIKVKTVTGDTDLRTLAAVLALSEVVVANSTGPLHLAVAVGTSVVGLYPSKKAMSPMRWGPLGDGDRIIQPKGVVCECSPHECRCMELIDPREVAGEVLGLINSRTAKIVL